MNIEIKPHRWEVNGERHGSHFFVFVDGEPSHELSDCVNCQHYRGAETSCRKLEEVGEDGDELIYPFCGNVCGYFTLRGEPGA